MENTARLLEEAFLWSRLRFEQDGRTIKDLGRFCENELVREIDELKSCEAESAAEPNDRKAIAALCSFPRARTVDNIEKRIYGALAGRFAGCTLGVPVENYPIEKMERIAREGGTPFPPTEYWHTAENPDGVQYGVDKRRRYTFGELDCVPVDDDVTYTVLGLLLLQKYGFDYTVEDVAELWNDILPYACTAEDIALRNIRAGVPAKHVADGNPYVEWIGAGIRADAFGYACAGDPAAAAMMCYNDSFLTHRRNGIYGAMYDAAAVAAAFTMSPLDALDVARYCIPKSCRLRADIDWAFSCADKVKDFRSARALIDGRFSGMNSVHIENNVCAIVFAVMLGGGDFTRSIAQSVAIGLDNDCNGATVGSIVGAHVGIDGIEKKWYEPFNDTVHTYLEGHVSVSLRDLVRDFVSLYKKRRGE